MKRTIWMLTAAAICSTIPLIAQEDAQEEASQKYKERYTGDLFQEADVDHDGYVTFEEAKAASRQVERDALGRKRFNAADIDNDGRLTPEEARKYKGFEVRSREKGATRAKDLKKGGQPEDRESATQAEPQVNREKKRAAMKDSQQDRREDALERRNRRVRPERR